MLNKLKFNNLVISNRKKIQQGRIQTINKLVQKIRKLKTLTEKRPDDVKCKERLRKSTQSMEQLKKLKRVDIMKRLLLLDKNPSAIITNGRATPEEVAVALLAINKVLQDLHKRFKEELQLSESNAETWKEELLELSKRRVKINRTEEKRQQRKQLKDQKALDRKRLEWLQENRPAAAVEPALNEDEDENEGEQQTTTTGVWNVEAITAMETPEPEQKQIKQPKSTLIKATNARKDKVKSKQEKDKTHAKQETKLAAEIVVECGSEDGASVENSAASTVAASEEPQAEELAFVVDPFFITETGENYLSTAVLPQSRINQNDKTMNKTKKETQGDSKWHRKSYEHEKKLPKKRATQKHNSRTETENLHPSWAAKQKLKPIITGFQGKKITFSDDTGEAKPIVATQQFGSNKDAKSRKSTANNAIEALHPSWAAKQKLKPTIIAFEGKKITFNNDD